MIPRVQPGQPVRDSASDHNLIADAANAFAESRWGDTFTGRQRWRSHDLVRMENGTGADQAVGRALALTNPLAGPSSDFPQFVGRFNFLGDFSDGSICQFGVLIEPTPAGEIKYAAVSGIVAALVQITDASHQFVCLPRNSTILRSVATGYTRILWKAGATGLQWCYLLLLGGSCCAPTSGSSGSPSSGSSSSPSSASSASPSSASSGSPSSASSGSPSSVSSSSSSLAPHPGECPGKCYYVAQTIGGRLKWVYTEDDCVGTNCDCAWNNAVYIAYCNGDGPLPPGYLPGYDCAPTYEGQIGELSCTNGY